MCFTGFYAPDFIVESTPKSRKVHRCYECNKEIQKGEVYKKVAGKWDGEFEEYKTCLDCEDLRFKIAEIEKQRGCGSDEAWCPYGMLYEVLGEYPELKMEN